MPARDLISVVQHLPAGATSALAGIQGRSGPLPAVTASAGMAPCRGRIHLSHGPAGNGHRPAVDALSRSTAHGAGVIGMVLSGAFTRLADEASEESAP